MHLKCSEQGIIPLKLDMTRATDPHSDGLNKLNWKKMLMPFRALTENQMIYGKLQLKLPDRQTNVKNFDWILGHKLLIFKVIKGQLETLMKFGCSKRLWMVPPISGSFSYKFIFFLLK